MNESNFTSLELSKKLSDAGCAVGNRGDYGNFYWESDIVSGELLMKLCYIDSCGIVEFGPAIKHERVDMATHSRGRIPTYDILNDICVKYTKEFFGKDNRDRGVMKFPFLWHGREILEFLQEGKKQEAEEYILAHSIFFNKK